MCWGPCGGDTAKGLLTRQRTTGPALCMMDTEQHKKKKGTGDQEHDF